MPKVLRIITRLNVGGPATHVVLADRGLAERGWETLLVHGSVAAGEAEIALADLGIALQAVPAMSRSIRPIPDARAFADLLRIIRRYRPNIIHTHLSKAGLLGRVAAGLASPARRVHTFHGTVFGGYFGEGMSAAIVKAERVLGHRTDRVLALSERQQAELLAYRIAPPERIRIVPLGLDLARFAGRDRGTARMALSIDPNSIVVLAMGRLTPIKRLDRLLRIVALAARERPDLHLMIVGDGSERASLVAQAAALGITERVTFHGWTTDTPSWYAAADIVVLTSDREGTPLALIEAAAAGRPVVAVDVGGVADVVIDGVSGFVVPPDDETAFADRLLRLASDPGLRERLGRGTPAAARRYDAARLVTDLEAVYRELL